MSGNPVFTEAYCRAARAATAIQAWWREVGDGRTNIEVGDLVWHGESVLAYGPQLSVVHSKQTIVSRNVNWRTLRYSDAKGRWDVEYGFGGARGGHGCYQRHASLAEAYWTFVPRLDQVLVLGQDERLRGEAEVLYEAYRTGLDEAYHRPWLPEDIKTCCWYCQECDRGYADEDAGPVHNDGKIYCQACGGVVRSNLRRPEGRGDAT